jgi:outer membrane receptor for ferrienterochelin and colicin
MHKRILSILFLLLISKLLFAQVVAKMEGYVRNEIGEPLIGASVYIENTSIGAMTDAQGYFIVEKLKPSTYNVVASYLGYFTEVKYNIRVKSVGNSVLNFHLKAKEELLQEVKITSATQFERSRETPLSAQSLSAEEIASYPGSNNDVLKVAQSFPGISPSPGGFRNDLIIRGGAPNETVYYLDGIEIPNINHFSTQGSSGGPVSLLNIAFIEDVNLATSAFGSQYDNPLSGVLQFKQREGNRTKQHTNFRIGASETAITHEGPFLKGNKGQSRTSYILSVRRSYLQYLFELIGLPIRPDYWDYQYKISHQIDPYNSLHLLGIGSIDRFDVKASKDMEEQEQRLLEQAPFIEQNSNTMGLSWKHRCKNGRGFMETALSNNRLKNKFSKYADNENQSGLFFRNNAEEKETKLRYAFTYFKEDWKWMLGANIQYSQYKNDTYDLNKKYSYETDLDFWKYGFFVNATRSFWQERFDLSLGIRFDYDTFTERNSLLKNYSPRIACSYEFLPDWKLKATWGRYLKLPPYTILGYQKNNQFVNKNVDYTVSNHFVLGVEKILSSWASVSFEGFYKVYSDYPVSVEDQVSLANKGADFDVLGNEEVSSVGKGRTYGVELFWQQKLHNRFYGIFSYTFYYSEFTGVDNGRYLPSLWDSRHLISLTGGYKLKKNWEVNARYRFAGRTPYVPTNIEQTIKYYPDVMLDYSRLGEVKLDAFHQLDIRVDKTWNFKKLSLEVYVDIENILMQTSPEAPEYILNRDEQGNVTIPKSLKQTAKEEGKLIPTLGIVIDF